MTRKVFCSLAVVSLALGVSARVLLAQVDRATIVGRVADTSGAVIVEAEVKVVRVSSNEVFTTLTTSTGDFTVVNLPVDVYNITISRPGFRTETRTGISLEIGRTTRVDFALQVGDVSQTVDVQAETPLLNTESPERSQALGRDTIITMPVRSRDIMGYVNLVPGAAPSRNSYGGGGGANTNFNIGGQRRTDNLLYLDGGLVTEGNGAPTFFPSLDALEQVEVKTGLYGAEFGIKPGGQIITITRSGTNSLHGTAFEFLRNDNLNARNFFDRASIPEFKNNQFGGVLGGPIWLPKLFNGKDRAWFFVSYSGERRRSVRSLTGLVPTTDERGGRFASTLLDPLAGAPFPNNAIPSNRINSVASKLLPFWPDPNTAGRGFNFTSTSSSSSYDANQVMVRIDLRQTDAIRWAGTFVRDSSPFVNSNAIEAFSTTDKYHTWKGALTNAWMIRPTVANDFSLHYYLRAYTLVTNTRPGFGTSLGIPQLGYTSIDANGVPTTSVAGYLGLGDAALPGVVNIGSWELRDNLSFNRGSHSFKTGFHGRKHFNIEQLQGRSGFTFIPRYTGQAFGDFLLGTPSSSSLGNEAYRSNVIQDSLHLYFQDSWKVTSRLTLSLGLRYEYRYPWKDIRGFVSNFDPATGQLNVPLQNLTLQPWETGRFQPNVPLISWTKNGWLPRLGVAYRPANKVVVRLGYGAYASEPIYALIESFGTNPRPNAEVKTFLSDFATPTLPLSDPFNPSNRGASSLPNLVGAQSLFAQAITHSYGISVQYELRPRTVVEVGYQGSTGVHEPIIREFNDATPGTGPRQQRRPYPQYQTIRFTTTDGTNKSQGMNVKVEHRPGPEGLSLLMSYTWIKAIDTVAGRSSVAGDPRFISRNLPLRLNQGLGEGNVPGRLALTANYAVPFGKGKSLARAGLAEKILGGWTVSSFLALQKGPWVTPFYSIDRLDTGSAASSRPNALRNPNLAPSERTPLRWFDTAAFATPAPFVYGNAGRSIIESPGIASVDLAVLRSFRTTESTRLEFRFEAYNATNHTNFTNPNSDFASPLFGVVSSALDPRFLQLGLKFYF